MLFLKKAIFDQTMTCISSPLVCWNELVRKRKVKIIIAARKIAETMSTFFVNVGTNLNKGIQERENSRFESLPISPHSLFLSFQVCIM